MQKITLEEYLALDEKNRIQYVKNVNFAIQETPFWLERIQTAVKENNPFAVNFNSNLASDYWAIKNAK